MAGNDVVIWINDMHKVYKMGTNEVHALRGVSLVIPRGEIIAIVGPTGVGKTEISIQLAERLNGEIVSSDSRLFYQGMDIGTAKPTLEEQARVTHHLIDVAAPDEVWLA